jgi:N,N'-diacetyllegionaminate synthase
MIKKDINMFWRREKVFIIAEIGNNHNGDFSIAQEMIKKAAENGADAVKFQTYNPDLYVNKKMPLLAHIKGGHKTQYERLKSIALSFEQYRELKKNADKCGIIFFSTPFDTESADFLEELVPFYKIASGDLTNTILLKHISKKNKPVILSTGMGSIDEIQTAVRFFDPGKLAVLHCVASYPTLAENVNLKSIGFLNDKLGLPIGYSDHTIGTLACRAAVASGAMVLEKHFTLDKTQSGGDHKISMDPGDLQGLVLDVREIEKMVGIYGKPVEKERNISQTMRRGLYARVDIPKGAALNQDMILPLRPEKEAIPISEIDLYLGKRVAVKIEKNFPITKQMFDFKI